jgi:tRNA (cytidine/uridine-2'-O-)-methyltransferase
MRIALYQPDIPQNLGSILRLCACLEVGCDVIEPCGFVWDDKRMGRVAMDYAALADIRRHLSWERFRAVTQTRLVLLTTKASVSCYDFTFRADDILLLGRESAGVPDDVASAADARIRIPMTPPARSLNLVQAACLATGEALRQTRWNADAVRATSDYARNPVIR